MAFTRRVAEVPDSEDEPFSSSPIEARSNVQWPPSQASPPPAARPGIPASTDEGVFANQNQNIPSQVLDTVETNDPTDAQEINRSQHSKTTEPRPNIQAPVQSASKVEAAVKSSNECTPVEEIVSSGHQVATPEHDVEEGPRPPTGGAKEEAQNVQDIEQTSVTVEPLVACQPPNSAQTAEVDWQGNALLHAKQPEDHHDSGCPHVASAASEKVLKVETEEQPVINDGQEKEDMSRLQQGLNEPESMSKHQGTEHSLPGEPVPTKGPLTGTTATTGIASTEPPSAPNVSLTNTSAGAMEISITISPDPSALPPRESTAGVSNVPQPTVSQEGDHAHQPIQPPQETLKSSTTPGRILPSSVKGPAKTSQEVTVAELKAQRSALIAALAAIPSIQEIIVENNDNDTSSTASAPLDSGPTDADVMTAANQVVKKHIKLLHEYNEIKDVGQGLMGLIADQRGVRIVEVQEEFGIGEKD
ncbi:uncharacterized protein EI97DRAFT_229415 [Westerdykella ornata]|uniref:Swi5-domain-containing protein n=1 Tax=Westerdykella ornata TaxID=318751 RepID=A0A6A6J7W8_WESOR|nr:uncharacterized protein EI97DRAFT_229415 [Westerdykella ornata]KAF2272294.1 hypothetical protein EI97DRAFT_229415 [Westerdykella ornata]